METWGFFFLIKNSFKGASTQIFILEKHLNSFSCPLDHTFSGDVEYSAEQKKFHGTSLNFLFKRRIPGFLMFGSNLQDYRSTILTYYISLKLSQN